MIDKKSNLTFELNNSVDLFNRLIEEYADFDKQYLNSRFAINCAITSWHLCDWTYNEYFKNDKRFIDSETIDKKGCKRKISGLLKYQNYVRKECPELEYMRLITNGIKHCVLNGKSRKESTQLKKGDFSSDFSQHDFNTDKFVIKLGNKENIVFEEILIKTINYWKTILKIED